MKKQSLASLVLAALVGGLAIHGALVACSGTARPAGAQSPSCQQWAFTTQSYTTPSGVAAFANSQTPFMLADGTSAGSVLAPEGWEPVTWVLTSIGSGYLFKRCLR